MKCRASFLRQVHKQNERLYLNCGSSSNVDHFFSSKLMDISPLEPKLVKAQSLNKAHICLLIRRGKTILIYSTGKSFVFLYYLRHRHCNNFSAWHLYGSLSMHASKWIWWWFYFYTQHSAATRNIWHVGHTASNMLQHTSLVSSLQAEALDW